MTTYHYQCQKCGFERSLADRGIRAQAYCMTCDDITRFEKQVWVSLNGAQSDRKYHTNPDCFQKPENNRQKNLALIETTFEQCRFCSGKAKKQEPDFGYQEALKKAAEGD